MKTIKILPSINNIDICGRITSDPIVSTNGNVMLFNIIRNFGGDKDPILVDFVYFKPKDGFPTFLKKGAPVIVHAYYKPNVWTDKDGVEHKDVQKIVKKVELAQLIEKQIKNGSEEAGEAEADDEAPDIKAERD